MCEIVTFLKVLNRPTLQELHEVPKCSFSYSLEGSSESVMFIDVLESSGVHHHLITTQKELRNYSV